MNVNSNRLLNLKYKGERNYVHGSDIYNALNSLATEITGYGDAYLCHLAIRRFCRNDAELLLYEPEEKQRLIGTGLIAVNKKNFKQIWIIESERSVTGRYAFDEQHIISSAVINDNRIILRRRPVYSPIEDTIALTKALSYELIPNIQGKWLFGQLDITRKFLNEHDVISIEQKSALGGRFSVNLISQNEVPIGEIRFIVGQP